VILAASLWGCLRVLGRRCLRQHSGSIDNAAIFDVTLDSLPERKRPRQTHQDLPAGRTGQAAAGPADHKRAAGLRTVAEAGILALRDIRDTCVYWVLKAVQQLNTWSVTQVTVSKAEPATG